MLQVERQRASKKRNAAAGNVPQKAEASLIEQTAKKSPKASPAKKAAPTKTFVRSNGAQKVASIVRGAEALQLLLDAGILTTSGNVRRRFK